MSVPSTSESNEAAGVTLHGRYAWHVKTSDTETESLLFLYPLETTVSKQTTFFTPDSLLDQAPWHCTHSLPGKVINVLNFVHQIHPADDFLAIQMEAVTSKQSNLYVFSIPSLHLQFKHCVTVPCNTIKSPLIGAGCLAEPKPVWGFFYLDHINLYYIDQTTQNVLSVAVPGITLSGLAIQTAMSVTAFSCSEDRFYYCCSSNEIVCQLRYLRPVLTQTSHNQKLPLYMLCGKFGPRELRLGDWNDCTCHLHVFWIHPYTDSHGGFEYTQQPGKTMMSEKKNHIIEGCWFIGMCGSQLVVGRVDSLATKHDTIVWESLGIATAKEIAEDAFFLGANMIGNGGLVVAWKGNYADRNVVMHIFERHQKMTDLPAFTSATCQYKTLETLNHIQEQCTQLEMNFTAGLGSTLKNITGHKKNNTERALAHTLVQCVHFIQNSFIQYGKFTSCEASNSSSIHNDLVDIVEPLFSDVEWSSTYSFHAILICSKVSRHSCTVRTGSEVLDSSSFVPRFSMMKYTCIREKVRTLVRNCTLKFFENPSLIMEQLKRLRLIPSDTELALTYSLQEQELNYKEPTKYSSDCYLDMLLINDLVDDLIYNIPSVFFDSNIMHCSLNTETLNEIAQWCQRRTKTLISEDWVIFSEDKITPLALMKAVNITILRRRMEIRNIQKILKAVISRWGAEKISPPMTSSKCLSYLSSLCEWTRILEILRNTYYSNYSIVSDIHVDAQFSSFNASKQVYPRNQKLSDEFSNFSQVDLKQSSQDSIETSKATNSKITRKTSPGTRSFKIRRHSATRHSSKSVENETTNFQNEYGPTETSQIFQILHNFYQGNEGIDTFSRISASHNQKFKNTELEKFVNTLMKMSRCSKCSTHVNFLCRTNIEKLLYDLVPPNLFLVFSRILGINSSPNVISPESKEKFGVESIALLTINAFYHEMMSNCLLKDATNNNTTSNYEESMYSRGRRLLTYFLDFTSARLDSVAFYKKILQIGHILISHHRTRYKISFGARLDASFLYLDDLQKILEGNSSTLKTSDILNWMFKFDQNLIIMGHHLISAKSKDFSYPLSTLLNLTLLLKNFEWNMQSVIEKFSCSESDFLDSWPPSSPPISIIPSFAKNISIKLIDILEEFIIICNSPTTAQIVLENVFKELAVNSECTLENSSIPIKCQDVVKKLFYGLQLIASLATKNVVTIENAWLSFEACIMGMMGMQVLVTFVHWAIHSQCISLLIAALRKSFAIKKSETFGSLRQAIHYVIQEELKYHKEKNNLKVEVAIQEAIIVAVQLIDLGEDIKITSQMFWDTCACILMSQSFLTEEVFERIIGMLWLRGREINCIDGMATQDCAFLKKKVEYLLQCSSKIY